MKMAVVGCEASGKTVFMCALADYFGRDAVNNPMRLKLTPENAAANNFERFQFRQMRCLRQWPPATPPDRTIEIKWAMRHEGKPVAYVDLLEFGGETYRAAFRDEEDNPQHDGAAAELLKYLSGSDFFVVLVSIKALLANQTSITQDDFDRETEALWVTRGILEFIRKNRPKAGIVIGLTQADKYRNELGEAGGPAQFFASHWPTIAAAANGIPVVEVASVSRTDDEGNPAEGYNTRGILPVMKIFASHCFGNENALETGVFTPVSKSGSAAAKPSPFGILAACLGLVIIGFLAYGLLSDKVFVNANKQEKPAAVIERVITNDVTTYIERPVTDTVERVVEKLVERVVVHPVTNRVEVLVEKVVEKPITNTVEKLVEKLVVRPVTNTVEKLVEKVVEKPITNTVEKVVEVNTVVEKPITNTVEKIVEKVVVQPVTNTVEKVVEKLIEKVVTNTVKVVVEKEPTKDVLPAKLPAETVVTAPTNTTKATDADLQRQVPPGYRVWTDYNGRKIIAKWVGNAVDESGITLVTRYDRRIDAVLWKFSPEDQAYIRSEIKRHADLSEILVDGKWIRNPMLRKD